MSPKRGRTRPKSSARVALPARQRLRQFLVRPRLAAILVALLGVGVIGAALLLLRTQPSAAGPTAISTVETADVHSLAFLAGSQRVLLGHHGGILESNDGGRTWSAWGAGADAMALGVAGDEPIVVAGHDVLAVASSDGRWEAIDNDLPNIDIHGFARDPYDAEHMWAYLATGGLYESHDGGARWGNVFGGHTFALVAAAQAATSTLIAVDPERRGIVASQDGGRNWEVVGVPPTTPVYAMAAARQGETLLLSGSEGLFRSDDGGQSFAALVNLGQPILAIAVTPDGSSLIAATRDRSIFRSDDGGHTWPGALP